MIYVHEVTNTVQMQKLENPVLCHIKRLELNLLWNLPFSHSTLTSPSWGGLWGRRLQWDKESGAVMFPFPQLVVLGAPLLPSWELLLHSLQVPWDWGRWGEGTHRALLTWASTLAIWSDSHPAHTFSPGDVIFSLFLFLLRFPWPWRLLPLFLCSDGHDWLLAQPHPRTCRSASPASCRWPCWTEPKSVPVLAHSMSQGPQFFQSTLIYPWPGPYRVPRQ